MTAYIGLGSNLGDRRGLIAEALELLRRCDGVNVTRTSELTESPALGRPDQSAYLNGAAEIQTTLTARDLLETLLDVERRLGRRRAAKWAARTIDLDLLLYGAEVMDEPGLTIPHPQMHLRSFVLKGLRQLNGDLVHPVLRVSVAELAERLNGADFALKPDVPQLVSIAGNIGVGKTTLARKLSEFFGCPLILEPYDTNPFLAEVYAGKKELALDSQLYFLTGRVAQLNRSSLAPGQIVVSDYVFEKEMIYARRLLNRRQLALYEKIYPPMAAQVTPPVLVIRLSDSAEACLGRIHRRNRPYEQRLDLAFLRQLDADYEDLLANWKICAVIRLHAADLDYTKADTVGRLANQLRCYLSPARLSFAI